MDSGTWSAIGTWFTAAIYIALLFYAIKQVREAAQLRHAQTRPFVIVDIEPGFLLFLTVQNIGSTLARNVRFSFTPSLSSTMTRPWRFEESPLLRDGLESLPPGRQHRMVFDTLPARINSESYPMQYSARVTYEDDEKRKYVDRYTLDMASMVGTSPNAGGIPELVKELAEMRKEMQRWTDGISGLLVHTRDKDQMLSAEREAFQEWLATQEDDSDESRTADHAASSQPDLDATGRPSPGLECVPASEDTEGGGETQEAESI